MSDAFMARSGAASNEPGPPAEGNVFAGSQWGGPDSWDGPVWSDKYHKYITKKDQEFDEAAEEVAKRHKQSHDDNLHKSACPCSVPSHHASYIADIKRRIEPLTATVAKLEAQIGELTTHVTKSGGESGGTKEVGAEHTAGAEKTLAELKGHVHDVAQKMHAIIKNAEKSGPKTGEAPK